MWPLFNNSDYFEICQILKSALKITKKLQGRQFQLLSSSKQGVQFIQYQFNVEFRYFWE